MNVREEQLSFAVIRATYEGRGYAVVTNTADGVLVTPAIIEGDESATEEIHGQLTSIAHKVQEGRQNGGVASTQSSGAELPAASKVDTGVPLSLF